MNKYIYIYDVCVCLCACIHAHTELGTSCYAYTIMYNHVQYTVVCMHTLLLLSSFDEPTAMPTWCASGDRAQFWWPTTSETTYLLHNNLNISSSIMFIHKIWVLPFLGWKRLDKHPFFRQALDLSWRPNHIRKSERSIRFQSLFLLIKIRFFGKIGVFRPEKPPISSNDIMDFPADFFGGPVYPSWSPPT